MIDKRRIIIAEDHTILRDGLKALLASNSEYNVVGEVEDGINAIRCVESLKRDLLILDLSMPKMNGLEAIREIKKLSLKTKILVLTVHKTDEYIFESLKAGADGYLHKGSSHEELLVAIKSLLQGKQYLSSAISSNVIKGYLEKHRKKKNKTPWQSLTQREREILKLIAEGHRNKEIADFLCISVKTVEKHRANLIKKLDLHNAAALTAYAARKGLITNNI